jgi:hypothetical protein
MKRTPRKLALRREAIRTLRAIDIDRAIGGMEPDPTTAATDGNNGCPSEATGCHTGFSACGTC